jgi:hypothetical protein
MNGGTKTGFGTISLGRLQCHTRDSAGPTERRRRNTKNSVRSNTTHVYFFGLKWFIISTCFNPTKRSSSGWYSNEIDNDSTSTFGVSFYFILSPTYTHIYMQLTIIFIFLKMYLFIYRFLNYFIIKQFVK